MTRICSWMYKVGESSHHRVIQGQLAEPLDTGHDKAVIRTKEGKEESHLVRPVAQERRHRFPSGQMSPFSLTSWIRSSM